MRKNGIIIAIDGPAGSGKSSVGKKVAKEIGYKFISTGKMYRAVAWLCIEKNLDVNDEDKILRLIENNPIKFIFTDEVEPKLMINGRCLDDELYSEDVAAKTSAIARLYGVRRFLIKEQRQLGEDGGVVMEGRDITTNVFPDAELKIYLDASPSARAERRVKQLESKGIKANYDEILSMIIKRDQQDTLRQYDPLLRSPNSIYIDTTHISEDEVVKKILELWQDVVK